jgi:hypothetical protein
MLARYYKSLKKRHPRMGRAKWSSGHAPAPPIRGAVSAPTVLLEIISSD